MPHGRYILESCQNKRGIQVPKTVYVSFKDFSKEIERFKNLSISAFRYGTSSGVLKSIPMLVNKSPVDTGLYAQSWDFEVSEKAVILGNYAPHAPIIEFGARPFKPPLKPLLQWAKRVLNDPSQPPEYSSKVWTLAIGTQKKIEKVGMQPKHILSNSISEIVENIRKELQSLG